MTQVDGELPERNLGMSRAEAIARVRLMAALKLFELGKISSGSAARLIGISRLEFFDLCSQYKVSIINIPDDQLEEELRSEVEDAESIFKSSQSKTKTERG